MKTLKIVVLLVLGTFLAQRSIAQARDEAGFPYKADPSKVVQIFPNPASPSTDYLTLKFELPHARKAKLAMHTIIGNTLEVESEILDDYEIHIKIKDLPSGYYLLAIHDEETNSKNAYKFLKR